MSDNEELIKALEKSEEVKEVKVPRSARVNKNKAKKGYAQFIILKDNRTVKIVRAPVEDSTVMIEGFPRIASADYCMLMDNKPTYIIPSWSMKPYSPVENYADTEKERMNMAGRRVILAKLEQEQIKGKKGLGGKGGWIIFGLVILGVGYYLLKGGTLF